MNRRTILTTVLIVVMTPFALRGCAAVLFRRVDAAAAEQAVAQRASGAYAESAEQVMKRSSSRGKVAHPDDLAAPTGASERVASNARASYEEAEQALGRQIAAGMEINRTAVRKHVTEAFEARQDLLRQELAAFRSRLDDLTRTLEDRQLAKNTIIDRRVDELLNPNLRWDVTGATPARTTQRSGTDAFLPGKPTDDTVPQAKPRDLAVRQIENESPDADGETDSLRDEEFD
jgi:hypothetical protein